MKKYIGCISIIIFIAVVISIGVIGTHFYQSQTFKKSDTASILFPWDPIEWDTLRDSPMLYKSLGEAFDDYPVYKPLIDDPSLLGFSPDESYFKDILLKIEKNHISDVNDAKLKKGCEKELTRLFKEAELDITPSLTNYDLKKNFINQLVEEHGANINPDLLVYASLRGLIRGLNDPYTNILTPKDFKLLRERLQEESFEGIGVYIELDMDNSKWLTILEPIEGTPAYKAGVQAGDIFEEIDGESTKNITLEGAVAKLRGPQGTPVMVGVRRKGEQKLLNIKIIRGEINVHSVTSKIIDNDVGYIRIRMFGAETKNELDKAITHFLELPEGSPQKDTINSIILDLRNNGGGYLEAAIDVSSRFISPGSVVYKRLDRKGRIKNFTTRKCRIVDKPLVVLVNRYSASSSEIVAGAIKSNKAGTLIGDRTFGKGSVQQIYPHDSGAAIKLTISYFLTPQGKIINKKGLKPDVYIDMKPKNVGKDGDIQLKEAIKFLKEKHAPPAEAYSERR